MVAELSNGTNIHRLSCSLAKISMVAEHSGRWDNESRGCSLAKISMVAELLSLLECFQ